MKPTTAPDLRRVEYVSLDDITPALRNAKRHEADGLKTSIQRFGFVSPALRDERTGRLVVGHGRTQALRQMRDDGDTPPAGVRVDGDQWLIPVVCGWSSHSDVEAEAYLLADNRYTELGGWDDEDLAAMLADIGEADMELLAATGFTEDDLAELLADNDGDGGPAGRTDPDDVPDPPEEAVTQPGDVWLLGPHRLSCSDATDATAAKVLMAGTLADCMWTDPPYGVDYVGKTKDAMTISNDGSEGLLGLLVDAFGTAAKAALKSGAAIYVAHAPGPLALDTMQAFVGVGWKWRQNLVWVKDVLVLGHSDYQYRHEPIIFGYAAGAEGRRGRGGEGWYGDHSQTSVFEIPRPKRSETHPTMKPVELVATMLANSCPPRGAVYDPFAGSGTTLLAANRLGRVAYLGELDPIYCDVICRRYQAHTGDTPILEATGEAYDFTPDLSADPAPATQ